MERLLLNLVGVGIVLFAEADSDGRMQHASASGSELARRCITADVQYFPQLVQNVAAAIWARLTTDAEAIGMTRALGVSAMLLQKHAPPKALLIAARSATCNADGICDSHGIAVARLVESVVATALVEGTLDHSGICRAQCDVMLRAVFAALVANVADIDRAAPAIVQAVGDRRLMRSPGADHWKTQDETESWHDDVLDELASRCSVELGLPRPLIDALIETEHVSGASSTDIVSRLDELVAAAVETLDGIRRLADLAGACDDIEAELLAIAHCVRTGQFGLGQHRLAALRPVLDDDTLPLLDVSRRRLLVGIEASRARLSEHLGEWREAACRYRSAARVAAPEDRLTRWRMKLAEGRALAQMAALPGSRLSLLTDAAQIYAEAGGIVCERDSPLEWAEANLELGTLLLNLGNRQCRPERFLAAALHFKPAVDILTRERAMDGWARGQIGLAHALRGQGSFQGDTVTLADAAFAYRAALGFLTRGMTPALWHEANAALGETLVRIAEETGDLQKLQEGIEILLPLVAPGPDALGGKARTLAGLALGRGMYLLLELEGNASADASMLAESLALIDEALAAPAGHLNALDRARGQRLRGDILLRQNELAGDYGLIAATLDAKSRAAELYLALENEPEAEQIGREIEWLRQQSQREHGRPSAGNQTAGGAPAAREGALLFDHAAL